MLSSRLVEQLVMRDRFENSSMHYIPSGSVGKKAHNGALQLRRAISIQAGRKRIT